VQDSDIANAAGANARRYDVGFHFDLLGRQTASDVAVFTDERRVDLPPNRNGSDIDFYLDQRDSQGYEAYARSNNHLNALDDILIRSDIAIPAIRAYATESLKGDYLAHLYAMRGYVIVQMAEDVCPGFPINTVTTDNQPIYSGPYTTDSALTFGLAQLDTALAYVHDSTDFRYLAQIVKGRALLDFGRYTEASAAVTGVPADFVYTTNHTVTSGNVFFQTSRNWDAIGGGQDKQLAVGDTEGVNGMPFVSAHDPRVGTVYEQNRYTVPSDSLYEQTKYTTNVTPVVIASGVEAQLIQAEAALHAGDPNWITLLNAPRQTAGMADLADPGVTEAQVDLLYRERAFWFYLTGRRLGDLRRLIRNYGRSAESVFPTGPYAIRGLRYGTATSIPFSAVAERAYNPYITSGCTTR